MKYPDFWSATHSFCPFQIVYLMNRKKNYCDIEQEENSVAVYKAPLDGS